MESQLQVLRRHNVLKRTVRRFRAKETHNPAYRMGIHQILHRIEAANDDHGCTSNLNFLRYMAAAPLGGKGFSWRNFREPSPFSPFGRPKNFSASGTEKPASCVASR